MKVILVVLVTVNLTLCAAKRSSDDALDLIRNAGYAGEAHQVETEDGYLLKVHRVMPAFNHSRSIKKPVFLMHGLFAASADYLVTGPEIALAYLLADNGYDVWLGNARGNKHSKRHKKLAQKSRKYWTFGWNEIGFYDLPAMIDYVLASTRSSQVFYVGHSQGTTSLLVLLSSRPEYNRKIIQAHLMAPAAFFSNVPHPFARILAEEIRLGVLGDYKYLNLVQLWDVGIRFSNIFCTPEYATTLALCRNIIFGIVGENKNGIEIDDRILKTLVQHISPRVSVMQITHFFQLVLSGKFRNYDYRWGNIDRYNSTQPSNYNLKFVIAPIYLYHGSDDLLISARDVDHLRSLLPNVRENRMIENFNHVDFTYGRNARNVLYKDILQALEFGGN